MVRIYHLKSRSASGKKNMHRNGEMDGDTKEDKRMMQGMDKREGRDQIHGESEITQ